MNAVNYALNADILLVVKILVGATKQCLMEKIGDNTGATDVSDVTDHTDVTNAETSSTSTTLQTLPTLVFLDICLINL